MKKIESLSFSFNDCNWSLLKFLAIAAGIAALVNGFAGFFGFGEETQTKEEAAEEAKQKSLEAGDDEFTAEMRGKQASAKVVREGFFDVPSWFGLRDEATDITTEKGFQNILQKERFKKGEKSFKDSENFQQNIEVLSFVFFYLSVFI